MNEKPLTGGHLARQYHDGQGMGLFSQAVKQVKWDRSSSVRFPHSGNGIVIPDCGDGDGGGGGGGGDVAIGVGSGTGSGTGSAISGSCRALTSGSSSGGSSPSPGGKTSGGRMVPGGRMIVAREGIPCPVG